MKIIDDVKAAWGNHRNAMLVAVAVGLVLGLIIGNA